MKPPAARILQNTPGAPKLIVLGYVPQDAEGRSEEREIARALVDAKYHATMLLAWCGLDPALPQDEAVSATADFTAANTTVRVVVKLAGMIPAWCQRQLDEETVQGELPSRRPRDARGGADYAREVALNPTTCRHYPTGGTFMHETCQAGVHFRTLAGTDPGIAYRLPCHRGGAVRAEAARRGIAQVPCAQWEAPTEAEIEADRHAVATMLAQAGKVALTVALVKRQHRGANWRGTFDCPVCGGADTLTIKHARNGHTSGQCATPRCFGWIE